jgi:hypothetical protein
VISLTFELRCKKIASNEIRPPSEIPTYGYDKNHLDFHRKHTPNMASADDDDGIPPMPSLPPIIRNAGQQYGDGSPQLLSGQNCPLAGVAHSATTPPPSRVNVMWTGEASATSSLSMTDAASASVRNSNKRSADDLASDDDTPSPKKALPDFSRRKNEEDSVASGDDSNGWEREEGRVMHEFTAQAEADDVRDDAAFPDIAMNETNEWEFLAEGNADELPDQPTPPPKFEKLRIFYQKTTGKALIEFATKLNIAQSGSKRKLFDRICNSGNGRIDKVDDDSFDYHREIVKGEKVPTWLLLCPEPIPHIPGIDMATGAQSGFFGPRNKENAVGRLRQNFLTDSGDRIERPKFAPKTKGGKKKPNDVRDFGGPSPAAQKRIGPMKCARPKDFFDLQITPAFISWMALATNRRATADGAGSGTGEFSDFVPFDDAKMYHFLGVLFANGLSPKPRVDYWFETAERFPLFGNNLVSRVMTKTVSVSGKNIWGIRRWRHFRRFLTLSDYRDSPSEKQKADPLWKVRELIDELNKQCKDMWIPGKWVVINEQTIGFQGASSMKLQISYKQEGDGFQCDALCDSGYTYSFWFRHGAPPDLGPDFKHLELSPTARRIVWLASRLPNEWTRIYMDNLFNSVKLFQALYLAKALAHGVARTSGCGVPPSVIQKEEKNKDRAEKLRGTTMAARLVHLPKCPDVLAVSTYDTKPVHLLSTAAETVEWIVKGKKVWSATDKNKSLIRFLHLNLIEDYNMNMNSTDIADQL